MHQRTPDDMLRRAASVLGAAASEHLAVDESYPEEVVLPAELAVPEVVAKLKAKGIKVIVANRKAQRKAAVRKRRADKKNPAAPPPRVFADGGEDAMLRRKARNKRKARDRKANR